MQRHGTDRANVGRHVLPCRSIATRKPGLQDSLSSFACLILQRQRQAIQLQLADVAHRLAWSQQSRHTISPGPQLGFVIGVVQRQHGARVPLLGKAVLGLATHPLRGRIRRDQIGVLGLQALELIHPRVVLRVRPFRGVQNVIQVLVVAKLLAKRVNLLIGRQEFRGGHRL